jgi:HK97 family phage prohead protease
MSAKPTTKSGIALPQQFKLEHKSVLYGAVEFDERFRVKAVDDSKGIIEAYASKFGNEDSYGDIVLPGSYKRALTNQHKANRPYLYTYLFQHDPSGIIGGVKDAEEDNFGLLYQSQCNLETQLGQECYSNAKMGVLYQSSIGYDIPTGGYEYKDGIRYLKEIRLWEISLVTFAANSEATVVGVKSRPYEIQGTQGKTMNEKAPPQKKTYDDHLADEMCQDLLEDFQDVYISAFAEAICDALSVADTMEADVSDACDKLKASLLATFVPQAITYNLPQYIADNSGSWSPADYLMQYGSDSRPDYGYMSSGRRHPTKAGRAFSGANEQAIQDKAAQLHDLATKAMKMMKAHTDAVHGAANDLASILGNENVPSNDDENQGGQEEEKSITSALTLLKGLRTNR